MLCLLCLDAANNPNQRRVQHIKRGVPKTTQRRSDHNRKGRDFCADHEAQRQIDQEQTVLPHGADVDANNRARFSVAMAKQYECANDDNITNDDSNVSQLPIE